MIPLNQNGEPEREEYFDMVGLPEPIIPVWKVANRTHTAFCSKCDVELDLGDAVFTANHPEGTPGEQFFVCPVCHGSEGLNPVYVDVLKNENLTMVCSELRKLARDENENYEYDFTYGECSDLVHEVYQRAADEIIKKHGFINGPVLNAVIKLRTNDKVAYFAPFACYLKEYKSWHI